MWSCLFIAGFFVVYPWLKKTGPKSVPVSNQADGEIPEARQININLFHEQQVELGLQLERGDISQAQHDDLQVELQKQLLIDTGSTSAESTATTMEQRRGKWLPMLCLAVLPVFAIALYFKLGAADDLAVAELLEQANQPGLAAAEQQQLRAQLLQQIDQRLAADITDTQRGPYLVTAARLAIQGGDFSRSASYYQKAVEQFPNEAGIYGEYAQASYFTAGNRFNPIVENAMARALQLDPGNATALGLKGIQAFESQDYRTAMASWQLALNRLPPFGAEAEALRSGIERAKRELGEVAGEPGVVVNLRIAPGFFPQPDQVVFLFAREWQGLTSAAGGSPSQCGRFAA